MARIRRASKVCPISGKSLSQAALPAIEMPPRTKKARNCELLGIKFGFSQEAMNSAGNCGTNQYLQRMKVSGNQAKVCQSDLTGLPATSQITSFDPPKEVTGATVIPPEFKGLQK
jgi:hypothetical protein